MPETEGSPPGERAPGWRDLEPDDRARAMRNYCDYQALPPEERRVIDARYRHWKQLSEAERERVRQRWEMLRSLPSPPSPEEVVPAAPLLNAEPVSASR